MFTRTQFVVVFLSVVHVCAGTQCTRCAPGKFKSPDMFFTPCTLCPNNTFSAVPGAAECTRCPPYSSSVMGSSRCTFEACRAGNYTDGCVCPVGSSGPDGGACDACVAGTYKNATGSAGCDNCSSTKTSVAGSASCFCKANYFTTDTGDCLECTRGMISYENSATCFCPNGTALVDGTCAQIYNKGLRLSGFLQVNETNSSNTSSADLDVLIKQIKSSIALQYNVSEDLVQVIFTTPSRNLLQESGLKVDVIIMAQSKEALANIVNKTSTDPPRILEEVQQSVIYNSLEKGQVFLCGDTEMSVGTSTACVCAPGYTRCSTCGKCIACAPGLAKPVGGNHECTTCSGNTFSRAGTAQCASCPFSAVTKDRHTSCSCNTAFVFFRDTCTPTESVYLNVTGVLRLPLGEFRDAELKQILLDGFSAYLNFSKEFITTTVFRNTEVVSNDTDNSVNESNINASNASATRRRLLFDKPLAFNFTSQFQIEQNDKITYAKILNFTRDAIDTIRTILDANGYEIDLQKAELTPGHFDANGKPLSKCADGQNRVLDLFNKLLFCNVRIPTLEPEQANSLWWLWLALGAGLAAVIVGVVVFRRPGHRAPATTSVRNRAQEQIPLIQNAMLPARLLVPATVSFEYQLVRGHLI